MFKRICTDMLKEENYIDALAYLCGKIASKKTIDAKETEFDRIDDATGQALRIVTALQIALDSCYEEAMEEDL